jgi:hypothetical protein
LILEPGARGQRREDDGDENERRSRTESEGAMPRESGTALI